MLPAGDQDEVERVTPHMLELIEIINKLLFLHLVGCLHNCINDARSRKYQTRVSCARTNYAELCTVFHCVPVAVTPLSIQCL